VSKERLNSRGLMDPSVWSRFVLPLATIAFHLVTFRQYGYFRDELYYLANGAHLGFGYVEHPPLIGLIAWAVTSSIGTSLFAVRLLPALAAGATVSLSGVLARELGGGRFAQAVACISTMAAPCYLGLFGVFTMNAFDVLFWAVCFVILARIFRTGDERSWILFGVAAGVGLENKISILFLGFGLLVGLLLTRHRPMLTRGRVYLGGAIAALIFLPHVVWQWATGWPVLEFIRNATANKNVSFAPLTFLAQQVLQAGPLSMPIWIAGLGILLLSRRETRFRPLGWIYLAVLAVMLLTNAKPHYLAPAYTMLFAAGSVAWERTAARWGGAPLRAALISILVLGGIVAAPMAKGILSEDNFIRYQAVLGVKVAAEERHTMGRLPQFFADMHGWPELASTVGTIYRSLPETDRTSACIFARNYGEAGALELFGPREGLPTIISGHNSYYLWGPRGCTGEVLIVIGDNRARLEQLFQSVEPTGATRCTDCMPYENDRPIWVARGIRQRLAAVWPQVKAYN
jgi:hypothetical protein